MTPAKAAIYQLSVVPLHIGTFVDMAQSDLLLMESIDKVQTLIGKINDAVKSHNSTLDDAADKQVMMKLILEMSSQNASAI